MAAAAVTVAACTSPPPPAVPASPDYRQIVEDEAYWVSTAQLSCAGEGHGAIAEARVDGSGTVSVHPYEANVGARAMVAAGPRYFPMVRRYLDWYLGHLNRPDVSGATGTVYDYDYDPVTCRGRFQALPESGQSPKYDSSDAYAGTFLTLVGDYAAANPADHAYLRTPGVRRGLEDVAGAIAATTGPDGLSAATPTYAARYLLDNVEARDGLRDYAGLLSGVLDDPAGAELNRGRSERMADGIEDQLWGASRSPGMYGWATDRLAPSWSTWYPDSFAQVWPVWSMTATPERRASMWAAFTTHWPTWAGSTPRFGSTSVEHNPNGAVALAAAVVGDKASVDSYLRVSEANWAATGRPAPWTVDDSGFRALAAQAASGL